VPQQRRAPKNLCGVGLRLRLAHARAQRQRPYGSRVRLAVTIPLPQPPRDGVCLRDPESAAPAQGMEYVHDAGVVHRDLSTSNVLLSGRMQARPHARRRSAAKRPRVAFPGCWAWPGEPGPGLRLSRALAPRVQVKIADFGCARLVPPGGAHEATTISGSPLFMSPEQLAGDPLTHKVRSHSRAAPPPAPCGRAGRAGPPHRLAAAPAGRRVGGGRVPLGAGGPAPAVERLPSHRHPPRWRACRGLDAGRAPPAPSSSPADVRVAGAACLRGGADPACHAWTRALVQRAKPHVRRPFAPRASSSGHIQHQCCALLQADFILHSGSVETYCSTRPRVGPPRCCGDGALGDTTANHGRAPRHVQCSRDRSRR
jgi:hypothetical protein